MTVLSALTPAASVSLADQFYGLSGANSRVFTLDQIRADVFWCGTAGGSANALTLTPSIPIPAYAAGQVFRFIPSLANTSGTVTVAVSGLAAKSVNVGSLTLPTPAFATSDIVEIVFDGTGFQLISQVYSQGSAFYHGWLYRGETVVVVICEGGWSSSRLNITHLILLLLMC